MKLDQRKAGVLLGYTGETVKVLTTLLYTPVMLRLLGQSEFGLYQMVSATVSYLSLLSMGFGNAYVRYHARYQVKNDQAGIARLNGMFMIIFCAMSAICLLCGGFMTWKADWIFGDGLTPAELVRSKYLLGILVLSMAVTFPNSVYVSYITAQEQFIFQKLINLLQSLLNPFITLPLLLLGYGSVAVVAVSAGLTVAVFLSNLIFCRKKLGMGFSFRGLEFGLLKEMWVFTFFIFLNQIVDQVNWMVDKFLLGRMVGTEEVAVYSIGGQINALYIQLATAVVGVFIPKVYQIVADTNDNAQLDRLIARVGRVQFLILALILTGLAFFGRPFIALWAGPGYEDAYWVALLLMTPILFPLAQSLIVEIQRAKNKHKVRSVVYICLAVCNVILSVVLIPRWGCIGAAAGTAVAVLFGQLLFMNWYYHKKLGLDMIAFWKQMLRFLPALVVVCLFGWAYAHFVPVGSWAMLLLSAGAYTVVYGAVMWLLGMDSYEKRLVKKMFEKLPIVGRKFR